MPLSCSHSQPRLIGTSRPALYSAGLPRCSCRNCQLISSISIRPPCDRLDGVGDANSLRGGFRVGVERLNVRGVEIADLCKAAETALRALEDAGLKIVPSNPEDRP